MLQKSTFQCGLKSKIKLLSQKEVKHFYELIQRSRYLETEIRKQVDAVIQRNAYFAHEENLLLTMLVDDRASIRQLALRRILAARKHRSQNCSIRLFKVPKVNFEAEQHIDLIDWQKTIRVEPPLTKKISEQDLMLYIANSDLTYLSFPEFPCHSQAVERAVQLVSEVSRVVCGYERRDGIIKNKLMSRNEMPKIDTKKDFNC